MANIYLEKEKELSELSINALIPLLKAQPYVNDVKIYEDERIDLDMNKFREMSELRYAPLSVVQLCAYNRYHNMSEPWIFNIEPKFISEIIINRTMRYPGDIDYLNIVKIFKDKITFIGLEAEGEKFCKDFGEICYYKTNNFLEVAEVISSSNLFIGNQSADYAIAEGLKHERILEVCLDAPNCLPVGKGSHCSWEEVNIINLIENIIN